MNAPHKPSGPPSGPPSEQPSKPPSGFNLITTLAWACTIAIAFVLVQGIVAGIYVTNLYPNATPEELNAMMPELSFNGTVIGLATLSTALVCTMMIWSVTQRRMGSYAASYLGFVGFDYADAKRWLLLLGGLMLLSNLLFVIVDRSVASQRLDAAFTTSSSPALLFIALVVAAPIVEEVFFRGFLFQGLRQSALGASGAVLLTTVVWTALHFQYGGPELFVVFFLGILLGMARWQSGSTLLPIAMHIINNLAASIQPLLLDN